MILPSPSEPFGLLESLHRHIVNTATPLTYSNWPMLFIVPLMPLGVLCFLAEMPNTRPYRLPLGVLGVAMIVHAIVSFRFDEYNAFNNGTGIAGMHLAAKYVEFALIKGPIVDPYIKRGRSRLLAAIDLAINSRMIGLGRVKLLSKPGTDKGVDDQVIRERWLPFTNRHRTRFQAVRRHVTHALVHYMVFDTILAFMWNFGASTIADARGVPGAVETFLDTTRFVLFPGFKRIPIPTLVVEIIVELSLGAGVWQGISMGYHTFAALAVGTGLWEVESWEVDMFDAPWKADSLLDMWGRRWHQLFRHHFILYSTLLLWTLRLPTTLTFVLPLVFIFSGALHGLGQIAMSPVPDPLRLAFFFVLSGVGGAIEATFRKVTGRRVGGVWGRVWTWGWFLYTGRWAARTWLDGGIGGSRLLPLDLGWRLGPRVVEWTTRWIFDAER